MPTTLDWLRGRSDSAVVDLLRARPDLAVPAPTDLSVLARRLDTPPSVWRAMESLNGFEVQVITATAVLGPDKPAAIAKFLGKPATARLVTATLTDLETLALVRGQDPINLPSAVRSALGEFPGGFGPSGRLTERDAQALLSGLVPESRALLDRLAQGQPRGSIGVGGGRNKMIDDLVASGLLLRPEPSTVLLPMEVCLALRGGQPFGVVNPALPEVDIENRGIKVIDGTAAGQATATVSLTQRLLDLLGRGSAPALKAGGLGVRELRKLAKDLGIEGSLAALHLELLHALGLIATTEPRAKSAVNEWTPTKAADDFAGADEEWCWAELAATWLDLRRDPARAGQRDAAGKVLAPLSPELSWVRGPADRRFVLGVLAALPAGAGLDSRGLATRLAWSAPLRSPERRDPLAAAVIAEATELGIVAFGGLTQAGRALLDDDRSAAAAALAAALPAPIDKVLIQADLTVVAPGRLDPGLNARLAQVADVESAGSATVYRVTPDSLRRAFDSGVVATELQEFFVANSMTGVPQALSYLIDDVARRHGVIRVGSAGCYLRSDDPALIDSAIALATASGVSVRRLAPTVAVSTRGIEDLLEPLRAGGLIPAAEDATGTVVDIRPAPRRTRSGIVPSRREPPLPSQDQLVALVGRMRSADTTLDALVQTPAEAQAVLRDAASHRGSVWIGYVDSQGGTTRRMIEPVAVSGGAVAAFDRLRGSMRTFALHRITGVEPVAGMELRQLD